MAATSLTVTVAHAIAFITGPLVLRSSSATIRKLQLALEASLTAHFSSSWVPSEPLRGSGRRCMTLSPTANPPRPIYVACQSANVDWQDWIAALGGREFDLFVDPGCVSVRFSQWGVGPVSKLITVWSEELARVPQASEHSASTMGPAPLTPTFVKRLREEDEEDEEELFAMIAHEIRRPSWIAPVLDQFPGVPGKPPSPASSVVSSHSRSSSTSSISDLSFVSDDSDAPSVSSSTSCSSGESKMSRRERARLARVHVDLSKKEVTNYDGGKTTVLTGGVMLGAPARRAAKTPGKETPARSLASTCAPILKVATTSILRQPYGPSTTAPWRTRGL